MAIATDTTPSGGRGGPPKGASSGTTAAAPATKGASGAKTGSSRSTALAGDGRSTGDRLAKSHLQRMDALARANHIRTQRAQLKRDLRAGRLPIHQILKDPPPCIQTAKVFDVLLAVPRYGRVKVNRVLLHCRISPSKTVGGLSERQRSELVLLLRR